MKRFFAELKRRRVFRVMAVYGAAAFAVLEAADLVSGTLPIPEGFLTALTVLVLAGFPVAVVLSWAFDLTPSGVHRTEPAADRELDEIVAQPARVRWPAGLLAVAGSVLFLVASWAAADRLGWLERAAPRPAYAVEDPLGSYVVLPFEHMAETDEERGLAERAAARLARQLRGWETVRVVPDFALAGALFAAGIESPVVPALEPGLQVARSQRVGTLIALTTEIVADSATLEALLYDVASGEQARRPIQVRAAADDVDALVAPVTQEILQIRDRAVPLETLLTESSSPHAHREFQAGLDALYEWRLTEAEGHFREAMASDSGFALPAHYLALTLYWMTSRDPERIVDMGPEIDRLSRTADALAGKHELRPGLRDHVSAFRSFWEGDYESARRAYRRMIDADSSDVEAWLLLGAVEFADPWLVERADGSLTPRKDLDLSHTAFERAARLAPELPLSYGHLFEIDRLVSESVVLGVCPAYERPGGEPFPPYATRVAENQVAFCPVPGDPLAWLSADEYDDADRSGHLASVREMRSQTSSLLERWVSVRPDQARPHEERAEFALWERDLADCTEDPARVDSLTALALDHTSQALDLRADTTPGDRVRLALLELALDDLDAAEALMEQALASYAPALERGPPAPTSAANVYLAIGRPDRAHDVLRPVWDGQTFGAVDPDAPDGFVMAGRVEPWFGRARLYGATGVRGPALDTLLAALESAWSEPEFTPAQRAALTHAALQLDLGPALAASPDVMKRWVEEWTDAGLDVPPVFAGLVASAGGDPSAGDWLAVSLESLDRAERVSAGQLFLTATLAARTGRDSIADALFAQVRNCPPGLETVDLTWGLRRQGRLATGEVDSDAETTALPD